MTASDAPLMLSVSGARGIVGRTMTPAVAATFAGAWGSTVRAACGGRAPTVVLGRDGRGSGAVLSAAAAAGLAGTGARVVDCGVVPTPTVGVMIGHHGADAGLVVTASHNPIEWNGIKCLNADGVAPPPDDAAAVIARFRAGEVDWADAASIGATETDDGAVARHVAKVLAHVDAAPIRARGFTVVLDSVNASGAVPGRLLLEELGCAVVHLNAERTGWFAHTPEPVEENLRDLARRTREAGAAVGFAQDPDADRLAIVDETGRYVGEEYTLALAASSVLETQGPGPLAANLSTSRMIDRIAAAHPGAVVHRTAVGEAHVAAAMQATGAVIGGEGNGGVIFPPVTWVRDSISSMALVLGLLARSDRPLSAVVDALPRFAMIKRKRDLSDLGGRDAAADLVARATATMRDLPGVRVDTADGVRADFPDGWVHLRPSNTEPIVRVIAEADTAERAEALVALAGL